jgi:hypothetical protein
VCAARIPWRRAVAHPARNDGTTAAADNHQHTSSPSKHETKKGADSPKQQAAKADNESDSEGAKQK